MLLKKTVIKTTMRRASDNGQGQIILESDGANAAPTTFEVFLQDTAPQRIQDVPLVPPSVFVSCHRCLPPVEGRDLGDSFAFATSGGFSEDDRKHPLSGNSKAREQHSHNEVQDHWERLVITEL